MKNLAHVSHGFISIQPEITFSINNWYKKKCKINKNNNPLNIEEVIIHPIKIIK